MTKYVSLTETERQLPFRAEDFGLNDDTWESLLEDVLDRESDRVEKWAKTRFESTQTSATLNGADAERDGTDLPLPDRPVIDVESVTVDNGAVTYELDVEEDVYVAETHIELLDSAPISRFPNGRRNVTVAWDYGYESVPGPITDGIIRLARNVLDGIETDGLDSESAGSWSFSYRLSASVKSEVRAAVRQYRPDSYYPPGEVF